MMLTKAELRTKNKKLRSQMTMAEVDRKSCDAAKWFLVSEIYKQAETIMVYNPLGNETDTEGIIRQIFADGKRVSFPVTKPETGEITAYYADECTEFEKGAFSVYEPKNTKPADANDIDVVIVPGIAFDKTGARVGFGKGCYDRFLDKTAAVKVGYCYGFQICDIIVADKHDIAMDYLVSETGMMKTKKEDVKE